VPEAYKMIGAQAGYDPSDPAPAQAFTIEKHLAHAKAVREAARDPEVAGPREFVAGHSSGGRLVQASLIEALGEDDSHTAVAVLFDCTPPTSQTNDAAEAAANARFQQLQVQGIIPQNLPPVTPWGDATEAAKEEEPVYWPNPRDPRIGRAAYSSRADDIFSGNNLTDYDLTEELSKVTVPTAVLVGELGPFGGDLCGRANADVFHVPLRTVKGSGHLGFLDNPSKFFPILEQAMDDVESGRAVHAPPTPAVQAANA
jgi:pimeloyl-ACP methyl ester carboxylesterase